MGDHLRPMIVLLCLVGIPKNVVAQFSADYGEEIPFSYRLHSDIRDAYLDKRSSDEHRLLQYLMVNYEKAARPVVNASTAMTVKIGFVLTQIASVDERNQVLTVNVWLEQEWTDEVLVWDPVKFGGIEMIIVPSTKIWLPDIVLYNNADDYNKNLMPVNVVLQHTGNVFWSPPTKMRSTCKIDTTYFPFDDQKCLLKLGSWIYDGYQLDVVKRKDNVDMTDYMESGEWVIINTTMVRNVNRYACCEEPFPDVTVNFHIRRKTAYHSYNIIAPCVMLSMLTMVVFWLPCDAGEKINLGLTVLLAFSVFMLMIGETMPETSDAVPLLGLYILSTEFIASLSVGSTVAILNFHYRGTKRNPVPNWLRKLTFRYMTRITFIRPLYSDDGKLLNRPPHTLPGYNHHKKNYMVDASKVYRNYNVKDGASTLNHVDPTANAEQSHHLEELRRLIGFSNNANYAQTSCDSMQSPSLSYMSTSLFSTAPLVSPDGDVVGRIKRLLNKFDEDKMVEETFAEWIEVGRIFDRFCFGVFFLLIFCTTLFLLVIYPLRDENG